MTVEWCLVAGNAPFAGLGPVTLLAAPRGDPLVDGPRVPHDILKVLGVEALSGCAVAELDPVG